MFRNTLLINCDNRGLEIHHFLRRYLYSKTKLWPKKYKKQTRQDLEMYWSNKLTQRWTNLKKHPSSSKKPKFYCLTMFPYPSGKLHMGHVRVYTISDAMAHFHRMNGKEVLHPMGWDAFGLPAENAALTRGLDPAEWTESNIAYMKKQLKRLNLCFDWEKEFSTCNPEYYKWTQYLFLKLFKEGLAYKTEAPVNWDPVDKTVLAEEQVDADGRSWRSGAKVEKRILKQWFLRTTKYSESLLKSLNEIEEDYGIKAMQRNWIGEKHGSLVEFSLKVDVFELSKKLPVFCTHPEHLSGASHVNVLPTKLENLIETLKENGVKTEYIESISSLSTGDHLPGITATNPFTNKQMPLIISDHHEENRITVTAVLGVPAVNEEDHSIAENHQCSIVDNSDPLTREEALQKIRHLNCGDGYMTTSNLHDWLISRQRRWGTPIPIVNCPEHGAVPIPQADLPVVLPNYNEPLDEWKKTSCPKCGAPATRETDTMDTFVDSSWYFFRFTDPHNTQEPFSRAKCDALMPVDLYIGGKEHAILHLYYARFISHFCADQNMVATREPFKKLLAQGIIKGKTFKLKSNQKYLNPDDVDQKGDNYVEKVSGEEVEMSYEKMSKSKLNGVDPEEFVAQWGITLTRLFVLYAAAPHESIHWDVKTDIIPGVMRWQMKLWKCVSMLIEARRRKLEADSPPFEPSEEFKVAESTNKTIQQVTYLFETSCTLSAAITSLMTLVRITSNSSAALIQTSPVYERSVCAQIVMATPLMPHFTSELWEGLRSMETKLTNQDWDSFVLDQVWPQEVQLPQATNQGRALHKDPEHSTAISQ